MEFFKSRTQYDFMGLRPMTWVVSFIILVVSIGLLTVKGLNFGLEFTGGIKMTIRQTLSSAPSVIKHTLEQDGFHGIRVQQYGSIQDISIRVSGHRLDKTEQEVVARLKVSLKNQDPNVSFLQTEFIGSEVGDQLVEQGGMAVLVSIIATMIYIALRFEYRLALSAALGLCYDACVILGIFAAFGFEFDLATLASVMAVLGYSLNDTIVVFDRVRENFRKVRKGSPVDIMNLSINQTLSRTIMTSWMTLLVVIALLYFGGESLFGFSMAFFVGIIIGTFSSIYVSGALALQLGLTRQDLITKSKTEWMTP